MRTYGQHRICQASRRDETLKSKPGMYRPGKVETHQMSEEEKAKYEKEWKERREKYPWRYVKKREYQPMGFKRKKDLSDFL